MTAVDGVDNEIKSSALELIGNTPIVALDRIHTGPGRILAKCEFMNPSASIKCRSSLYMVQRAIESGELQPGRPVLEKTSGNQGCGLAVVCAVLGHPFTAVMSKGNSVQRALHMEALGAKCIRIPQVSGVYGNVTFDDVKGLEELCLKMVEESGAYFVNQFCHPGNVAAHYKTTGPEIWKQIGHHVDVFVSTVGTAGTFAGVSKYLKEKNPNLKSFVVEPAGAEAIKGGPIIKPLHLLQGSGYGLIPPLFNYDHMYGTVSVTDEEAVEYMNLLGTKEGLYLGYTSGANVAAAVKLLESGRVPKDSWIVTTLNDTGLKYTPVPEELKT